MVLVLFLTFEPAPYYIHCKTHKFPTVAVLEPMGQTLKNKNMKKQLILIVGILLSIGVYAQKGKLQVYGDKITIPINVEIRIGVEIIEGQFENINLLHQANVKEPIDMMKTLSNIEKKDIVSDQMEFTFSQADFMGSKVIVLTTLHHLENPMTYKAKIKIKGRNDYMETTIKTKYPNVFSVEQWQDDIESIVIYDFRIIEE